MPSYVIKVDPVRDEYVYWSTVVEAPIAWGTRADILTMLTAESDPWLRDDAPHHPNNRMARADEFGTSCNDLGDGLRFYSWDEESLIYQQAGMVARSDLWELCTRLEDEAPVLDLLKPVPAHTRHRGRRMSAHPICVCGHSSAWHYTSQWGHTAICHFDCRCTKYRPEGMWEEMRMKDGTKVTRLSDAALADAFALLDDMEETLNDGNAERTTEGTLTAYEWWRDLRAQQDRRLLADDARLTPDTEGETDE